MYAQICKLDNRVALIGGVEDGLPINNELSYSIPITDETVETGMFYDLKTGTFYVNNHYSDETNTKDNAVDEEKAFRDTVLSALADLYETMLEGGN